MPESPALARLLAIMARLRDPENGCPWDVQQTFATIAPYTIEEAYEVADAIERGDTADLKEELGDLLLQVVFHARIAEEAGQFAFDDIAAAICDKMVRRHPHVFEDANYDSVEEQTAAWEASKAAERAAKGKDASILGDVPRGLPALSRAVKLTKRAARVGFEWPSAHDVLEKLDEEIGELKAEMDAEDQAKIRDELGDVLFVMANLSRQLGVEPEDALRAANAKFERRFGAVERSLGERLGEASLKEMDAAWDAAKAAEKG
jgi:MazG family protein